MVLMPRRIAAGERVIIDISYLLDYFNNLDIFDKYRVWA